MTLFTSRFKGCQLNKNINEADVIRKVTSIYTIYREAKNYLKTYKLHYDLIVDEINTRSFLTSKFVENKKPIIALIHQLDREFWFHETQFPLNYIG